MSGLVSLRHIHQLGESHAQHAVGDKGKGGAKAASFPRDGNPRELHEAEDHGQSEDLKAGHSSSIFGAECVESQSGRCIKPLHRHDGAGASTSAGAGASNPASGARCESRRLPVRKSGRLAPVRGLSVARVTGSEYREALIAGVWDGLLRSVHWLGGAAAFTFVVLLALRGAV